MNEWLAHGLRQSLTLGRAFPAVSRALAHRLTFSYTAPIASAERALCTYLYLRTRLGCTSCTCNTLHNHNLRAFMTSKLPAGRAPGSVRSLPRTLTPAAPAPD